MNNDHQYGAGILSLALQSPECRTVKKAGLIVVTCWAPLVVSVTTAMSLSISKSAGRQTRKLVLNSILVSTLCQRNRRGSALQVSSDVGTLSLASPQAGEHGHEMLR